MKRFVEEDSYRELPLLPQDVYHRIWLSAMNYTIKTSKEYLELVTTEKSLERFLMSRIEELGVAIISRMPQFKFHHFKSLARIVLPQVLRDDDKKFLIELRGLTHINLFFSTNMDDETLSKLTNLTSLTTGSTIVRLNTLNRLTKLTSFSPRFNLTDGHLKVLPNVINLSIWKTGGDMGRDRNITQTGLSRMTSLTSLDLQTLAFLPWDVCIGLALPNLQKLKTYRKLTRLNLSGLAGLEELFLYKDLSDAKSLFSLTNLKTLHFHAETNRIGNDIDYYIKNMTLLVIFSYGGINNGREESFQVA